MSLSQMDRKKLLIAAGVVVLAVIVLLLVVKPFKRRGRGAGRAGGFGGGQQPGATTETAAPVPGAPAAAPPAAPGATMFGPIRIGMGSEVPTRPDPFVMIEPPLPPPTPPPPPPIPPPPPPPELVVNPPPVGLVSGGLRPREPEAARAGGPPEIAQQRVAGLLFNEGARAILEAGPGQTFVVKPGDIVQGNRIVAISRDAIYLVDAEGRRWRVELRGKGVAGGATFSESSSTVSGMPGNPPPEL